jgi:antitoxin (DNA-binding transcriptional repressor) of toxin-antitoxin stability system
MKTATVRELRNQYSTVLKWIDAGEEVAISRRGVVIARLVPERAQAPDRFDWTTSAAFRRNKSKMRLLSAEQSAAIIADASGRW